jgi:hypothetical protein
MRRRAMMETFLEDQWSRSAWRSGCAGSANLDLLIGEPAEKLGLDLVSFPLAVRLSSIEEINHSLADGGWRLTARRS